MAAPARAKDTDADWELVTELVNTHRGELEEMNSHTRLLEWAKAHGLDTPSRFGKFKHRLSRIGVDYNELREAATRREEAELRQATALEGTPHITLFAAGDAEAKTFAVCDGEGTALWYNTFHDDDRHFSGDDVSAETSAAEKAVWLAGQAREAGRAHVATLELTVSHHEVDHGVLRAAALRARVVLALEIADRENPAVRWCRENGYRSWKEAEPLADLLSYDPPEGVG